MSKIKVKCSFATVTEESAAEGDFADSGWVDEEGIEFDDVDEVVDYLKGEGVVEASSSIFTPGVWYDSEAEMDMHTGAWETKSYFIENVTEEQELEIYRKLKL